MNLAPHQATARQNDDPMDLVGHCDDRALQPEGGFETRPYQSWKQAYRPPGLYTLFAPALCALCIYDNRGSAKAA